MEIPYKVEYRNVKYPRLEFRGLQLIIILPPEITDPSQIIVKKKAWIERKWNLIQEAIKQVGMPKGFMIFGESYSIEHLKTDRPTIDLVQKLIRLDPESPEQQQLILKKLKSLLERKIESIIKEYSEKLGVKPNKVLVRKLETKWGSCSGKGNITLNLKLVCLPEQIIRYIIYHEMTHLKYKKHRQAFWRTISREFPEYEQYEEKLFGYWFQTEMLLQNLTKRGSPS